MAKYDPFTTIYLTKRGYDRVSRGYHALEKELGVDIGLGLGDFVNIMSRDPRVIDRAVSLIGAANIVEIPGRPRRRSDMKAPLGPNEPVPVLFRVWPESEGGGVIAIFPTDEEGGGRVSMFEINGGHGAGDLGIIHRTRPATPEEYAKTKRVLEGEPYRYKLREEAQRESARVWMPCASCEAL
jgi:hypothetical protein